MFTVEKNSKEDEVCIHGTPEDLREFAKKLWSIAEKSESKDSYQEQITNLADSDLELSTKLQGDAEKYSAMTKLTVCGHGK